MPVDIAAAWPRMMYRGFKQECPNGAVNEDTFKEIYEKFFPYGSKLTRLNKKEEEGGNEEGYCYKYGSKGGE